MRRLAALILAAFCAFQLLHISRNLAYLVANAKDAEAVMDLLVGNIDDMCRQRAEQNARDILKRKLAELHAQQKGL